MRTRSLFGALLTAATLAAPSSGTAQAFTEFSDRRVGGLFDGFGIGLAYQPHASDGFYGDRYGNSRVVVYTSSHRAARAYDRDDYCWEESWDLRWDQGYYGWTSYGSYDHLDFYHDCLRGGIDFAYDQWRWHARRPYGYEHGYGYPQTSIALYLFVRDPLWHPHGPFLAYDPGRWSGADFGARNHLRGWGRSPTVVAVGRQWPIAEPRFKEDPRVGGAGGTGRTAKPRTGQAAPIPSGGARVNAPSGESPSTGRRAGGQRAGSAPDKRGDDAAPPSERRRPSDGLGGSRTTERAPAGAERAPEQAEPSRPSDAARGGRDGRVVAAPRPGRAGSAAVAPREARPSEPQTDRAPRDVEAPRSRSERPSTRTRSDRSPSSASSGDETPRTRSAPSARSDGGDSSPKAAPRDRGQTAPRSREPSGSRERPARRRPADQ